MEFKKNNQIAITGKLVSLELFQERDITEEYIDWLNDKRIVKYSNQRFITHDWESSKSFFNSFSDSPNYFFKISEKDTMKSIGTMTLYINPNHGTADIGILIGNMNYWNGGFGFDAWNSLMDWTFTYLNIRKVTAGTLSCNIGMQKIMKKSGMTLEGKKVKQEIVDSIEEDILLYAKFHP